MNTEIYDRLDSEKIAIVGMAGRFPGAKDLETFWKNLKNGVESITHFTDAELLSAQVDPQSLRQSNYVKAKPMLDGVELFDAGFFGFNQVDAACMDPQYRLFMECVWEAIENAGYAPSRYEGAISVYAGARISSYLLNNLYKNPEALDSGREFQTLISNNPGFLTTAIAHKLDLKGPCYTIETFCSTSLVTVHVACQSLLNFECDMAVAGGVAISVPQKSGYWYHEGSIVSPDGHCRPFDARANGTVFGNGLGAVVLKRLEDALADGDHIEAVIIGSALNNDGSLKTNYAAPSAAGQAEVIVEALANAGIDPETISYVEAHGTGTVLGDPVEVAALTQAFRTGTQRRGFCALGSVKANIGHLDTAAGVAGLIKTVLALKHRVIPPNIGFSKANPEIDFENTPLYVNSSLLQWESDGTARRAGVSSFGVGGTNAHVILEEAPAGIPSGVSRPMQILTLSARTEFALDIAMRNLLAHLRKNPDLTLADVGFTLNTGRKEFNHRHFAICKDVSDAIRILESTDDEKVRTCHVQSRDPDVVFIFPGENCFYVNRGLDLYDREPVFKEAVDQCSDIVGSYLDRDLLEVLYPGKGNPDTAKDLMIRDSGLSQSALFALEYGLARLWNSWGIHQSAMIGNGIGEYVAACLADIMSLKHALKLVAMRAEKPKLQVEPVSRFLRRVKLSSPAISVVSGTTGEWISPDQARNPAFWEGSMQGEENRFIKGLLMLLEEQNSILLEIGSGADVVFPTEMRDKNSSKNRIIHFPCDAASGQLAWDAILNLLGQLWLNGVSIDWKSFYSGERRHRVELPTYPFERKRYWIESVRNNDRKETRLKKAGSPLHGTQVLELRVGGSAESKTQKILSMLKEDLVEFYMMDMASVDESEEWLEMGLDSLSLTRWIGYIEQKFGVELSFNQLLGDLSSLNKLADFIAKELYSQNNKLPQENGWLDDKNTESSQKLRKENATRKTPAIKRIPREYRRMKRSEQE